MGIGVLVHLSGFEMIRDTLSAGTDLVQLSICDEQDHKMMCGRHGDPEWNYWLHIPNTVTAANLDEGPGLTLALTRCRN